MAATIAAAEYAETVTDSNLEIVKKGYEALARGGFEDWLPYFDSEFEMTTPPDLASEPGTYRGQEGVRRWWEEFYEAMDEVRLEPHDFLAVGEYVVVPFEIVTRGRTTGLETRMRAVQVWHLRDGKAIRLDVYAELEQAVAAAESGSG
jgi:ketosteroid isomerase-like protein